MCGICGIVNRKESQPSEKTVRAMCETIRHRGPDEDGFFSDAFASLGMRRLSVIDLKTGTQPMSNEDGAIQVVYNGEIFNFPDLRAQLELKGHLFHTQSDTEVIPHLYEEYGEGFPRHLNGMFGIALWDTRARKLMLVRDRMGVKPLYYAPYPDRIVFGSEAKAVLAAPNVSRDIDLFALNQYLTYDYVPPPRSIYRDIRKLAPGELLIWRDGVVDVRRWWDPPADPPGRMSEEEAAGKLHELIRDAVRIRLISDVPLGVFLSGGVDSTTTAAFAAQFSPHIKSFCIGFTEPTFDESAFARRAAAALGTDHHEDIMSLSTALSLLPDIFNRLDEPICDPSVLPTYMLSRFTRGHVTVSLSGDGGDELFAGYPTYQAHKIHAAYHRFPSLLRAPFEAGVSLLPASERNMSLGFKLRKFIGGAGHTALDRHFIWLGAFSPREKQDYLSPAFLNTVREQDVFEPARAAVGPRASWPDIDVAMFLDQRYYLGENLMTKVDRTSMMHSLEVRTPFLDYRVVEFAAKIPTRLKLNRFKTKYILKQAVRPDVPGFVLDRKKKGFGIPLTAWIKKDIREEIETALRPEKLRAEGLFNPEAIRVTLEQHLSGKVDQRKKLWSLYVFQKWKETWAR